MQTRRVGILVPSSNTAVEQELVGLLPSRVSFHCARVGRGAGDLSNELGGMVADLEPEARKLATISPHAVAYACTSGSFADGPGSDAVLCERIAAAAGVRATTATTAAVWALRQVGARRIVFCSPYEQHIHELGLAAFAHAGFDVSAGACLGLSTNAEIGSVAPEDVEDLVRRSWTATADALFLSCTGLRSAELLPGLARELRAPVLSSNTALASHVVALADAAAPEPVVA